MRRYRIDTSKRFVPREKVQPTFTAGQIAAVVGISPKAVRDALAEVPPTDTILRGGNLSAAFSFEQLPERLQEKVAQQQAALCYRSAEDVLADPRPQWVPATPLSGQTAEAVENAHRLKQALARYLRCRNDVSVSADELLKFAEADYEAVFGRSVSQRHLRTLIDEVLSRDNGREEFERVELYLSNRPVSDVRKPSRAGINFPILEGAISSIADLATMTPAERGLVWRAALDEFHAMCSPDQSNKPAKKKVLGFLQARVPRLATSWNALRVQFDRKLATWEDEGIAGLCDKRKGRSGRTRRDKINLCADERLLLARANAVGGGISQAFRELYLGVEIVPGKKTQFSPEFRSAFTFNVRENKSYVPQGIRDKLRPLLKAVEPFNRGQRAVKLAAPALHLDKSRIPSGAWMNSDDMTSNEYVFDWSDEGRYVFDGRRFDVLRTQLLPLQDYRTDFVYGFDLLLRPQYTSDDICALIDRICGDDSVGLPLAGFVFEGGRFQANKVKARISWANLHEGFSREGVNLSLIHARRPQGKPIERAFNPLQNFMQAYPGYAGRMEMKDGGQELADALASLKEFGQPLKAEADPEKLFLSAEKYAELLTAAFEQFNHEPQNGKHLRGLSPSEAQKEFSSGQPRKVLPASLRFLISTTTTDKPTIKVSRKGIAIGPRLTRRHYLNGRLGELIGEQVIVRWNGAAPDHVIVVHPKSDPQGLNPFVVPHDPAVDAMYWMTDEGKAAVADAKKRRTAFMSAGRTISKMLKQDYVLTVRNELLGPESLRAAGEAINRVESEHREKVEREQSAKSQARQFAKRAGYDPSKIKNPERAAKELSGLDDLKARILAQEAQNES